MDKHQAMLLTNFWDNLSEQLQRDAITEARFHGFKIAQDNWFERGESAALAVEANDYYGKLVGDFCDMGLVDAETHLRWAKMAEDDEPEYLADQRVIQFLEAAEEQMKHIRLQEEQDLLNNL